MPSDTVTFKICGEQVSMECFAVAIRRFTDLLTTLNVEVGKGAQIKWFLSDLSYGSATATARAEPADEKLWPVVEEVTASYIQVGSALRQREPIPFSKKVEQRALRIRDLLDGAIDSIGFETYEDDVLIESRPEPHPLPEQGRPYAYGAVKGRVQALTSRGSLRFTLYDMLEDRAVSCYMEPGHEDQMKDIWGRYAIVEGWLKRHAKTGRPLVVRRIRNIALLPEPDDALGYRQARGAVPRKPDQMRAEDAIRRVRDAR
jgi:hypothetical protein